MKHFSASTCLSVLVCLLAVPTAQAQDLDPQTLLGAMTAARTTKPAFRLEGSQLIAEAKSGQDIEERALDNRRPGQGEHFGLWIASVFALVGANVLDARSSWGKLEANPVLADPDGRFGLRSIGIKSAMIGAAVGLQQRIGRARSRRVLAIENFCFAGADAAVAARNFRIEAH